jgi:hypothetical protein
MLMSEDPASSVCCSASVYARAVCVPVRSIEDHESDIAHRRFNPLPAQHDEKWLREVMRATIFEVCSAYELLSPRYFKPILDNILHLGLEQPPNA